MNEEPEWDRGQEFSFWTYDAAMALVVKLFVGVLFVGALAIGGMVAWL